MPGQWPEAWQAIWSENIESYSHVALLTLVVYDYFLRFDQEVECIWKRKWSLTTALYIIVCYFGMFAVVASMLLSFSMEMTGERCLRLYLAYQVVGLFVIAALQAISIIRIHALYNRSRTVLYILLGLFILEQVTIVTTISVLYAMKDNISSIDLSLGGVYECNISDSAPMFVWMNLTNCIAVAVFEVVMVSMALYRIWLHLELVRNDRRSLKLSASAEPSSWAALFKNLLAVVIRDNILYFVLIFVFDGIKAATLDPSPAVQGITMSATVFESAVAFMQGFLVCMIGPYLVLSLRRHRAVSYVYSQSEEGTEGTQSNVTTMRFREGNAELLSLTEAV